MTWAKEAINAAAIVLKRRLSGVIEDGDEWDWESDARAVLDAAGAPLSCTCDYTPLENMAWQTVRTVRDEDETCVQHGMARFQEALSCYYDSGAIGDPPKREDYK